MSPYVIPENYGTDETNKQQIVVYYSGFTFAVTTLFDKINEMDESLCLFQVVLLIL